MTLTNIKEFFKDRDLPEEMMISECEVIVNPKAFVEAHISFLEANSGNKRYLPYYQRLMFVVDALRGVKLKADN